MGSLVHVASLNRNPARGGISSPEALDALRADTEPWVVRAAAMGAQVLLFTETYPEMAERYRLGADLPIEDADSGSLEIAVDLAQRHQIDLVWQRKERGPDGIHNTSTYVNRAGDILGRYHKMFPTIGEMEIGVRPGDEAVVIETEYGRVGFAICFDLNFDEVRNAYRALQPDLIFFASAYPGGFKVPYWSLDLGCYMVSAVRHYLGQISDRRGRVLEHATYEALITSVVNLNSVQLHMDDNWEKMDQMLAVYGSQLRFDYATDEGRYQISSTGPRIDDLIEEFGLIRLDDYFTASRQMRLERL